MARGAPDDYQLRPTSATFPVGDLAELAARRGSPVLHDRRGDVLYWDIFDNGLRHCGSGTVGAASTVTAVPTTARHGANSIRLLADTGANDQARILFLIPYRSLSNLGVEIAFTVSTQQSWFELSLLAWTGTRSVNGRLRFDRVAYDLQYYDSDGNWKDLDTNLQLPAAVHAFNIMKLVVDPVNEMYVRAVVNASEYDLSAYAARAVADPSAPATELRVIQNGGAAATTTCYVDDFIFTQDEP